MKKTTFAATTVVCLGLTVAAIASGGGADSDITSAPAISLQTNKLSSLPHLLSEMSLQGYSVGIELDSTPTGGDLTPEAYRAIQVAVEDGTVLSILDEHIKAYPSYRWAYDVGRQFINVFPVDAPLSLQYVGPFVVEGSSLEQLFNDDLAGLSRFNVRLQERRGRQVFGSILIDLDFAGGTLSDYLNALALAIGDNVSWRLIRWHHYARVEFQLGQPVSDLPSYHNLKAEDVPLAEQIVQHKTRIAAEKEPNALAKLFLELARLYAKNNDVSASAAAFDHAFELSDNDKDKWSIEEAKLLTLAPITGTASAEKAIPQYLRIIDNCPYEEIRLSAMLEAAYAYRVLGKMTEGAELLQSAYEQYPRRSRVIYRMMQIHFPEYIDRISDTSQTEEWSVRARFGGDPSSADSDKRQPGSDLGQNGDTH